MTLLEAQKLIEQQKKEITSLKAEMEQITNYYEAKLVELQERIKFLAGE